MSSGEAALIAFSISSNVLLVPQSELLNRLLDNLISSLVPHRLGTVKNNNGQIQIRSLNLYTLYSLHISIPLIISSKEAILLLKVNKGIHTIQRSCANLPVVCVGTSTIPVTLIEKKNVIYKVNI